MLHYSVISLFAKDDTLGKYSSRMTIYTQISSLNYGKLLFFFIKAGSVIIVCT